jgi:hypothetical protein
MGNRLLQTVNSVATRYLLDTQPGLALVLGETTNAQLTTFTHRVAFIRCIITLILVIL